jgi:hypothetical protein
MLCGSRVVDRFGGTHLIELSQLLQRPPVRLFFQSSAVGEVPAPKVEEEHVIGTGHCLLQHLKQPWSLQPGRRKGNIQTTYTYTLDGGNGMLLLLHLCV